MLRRVMVLKDSPDFKTHHLCEDGHHGWELVAPMAEHLQGPRHLAALQDGLVGCEGEGAWGDEEGGRGRREGGGRGRCEGEGRCVCGGC